MKNFSKCYVELFQFTNMESFGTANREHIMSLGMNNQESLEWEDEMRARQSQHDKMEFFSREASDYVKVIVNFDNYSFEKEVPKVVGPVNEFAEPFGWTNFQNIRLANISIRTDSDYCQEYIQAVYWGVPQNVNVDSFVKENVRILRKAYVPRDALHNLPEYATEDGSYDTTDVRTYTGGRQPNPWCRGSLCVLYVNREVSRKIMNHPACNTNNWGFCKRAPYIGK